MATVEKENLQSENDFTSKGVSTWSKKSRTVSPENFSSNEYSSEKFGRSLSSSFSPSADNSSPKSDQNRFIKSQFPFHYSFSRTSFSPEFSKSEKSNSIQFEEDSVGPHSNLIETSPTLPLPKKSNTPPLPPRNSTNSSVSGPKLQSFGAKPVSEGELMIFEEKDSQTNAYNTSSSEQNVSQEGAGMGSRNGKGNGNETELRPDPRMQQQHGSIILGANDPLSTLIDVPDDEGGGKSDGNEREMGELVAQTSEMHYSLRNVPPFGILIFHAVQHFLSLITVFILIPHIIVPAAGGTDLDLARVISSSMMVSGIATVMHVVFGTRLPLVQGNTFSILAPTLAVIYMPHNTQRLAEDRFEDTMRDLMGAALCAGLFQMAIGASGLVILLLDFITPVVVASTIAAVGLSFFPRGFTLVGTCVEIGIPQLVVVVIFAMHMRRVAIGGFRLFQIHAISLALALTWLYAFILTKSGAYDYGKCKVNGSVTDNGTDCVKHVYTMANCRTDVSNAINTVDWMRPPYPFQWGSPTFNLQSILIMAVGNLVASIDSIGTYHGISSLVATRPPPPGVVSRGIAIEGLSSSLSSLFGLPGVSTIPDSLHIIAASRMGCRMVVGVGALVLLLLSLFGHIGALLASIPPPMVGGLLCISLSMTVALGLSSLRYMEMGSSRNLLIVGLSMFLSLSVPSYFSSYSSLSGVGPIHTGYTGVDHVLNTIFSFNMIIAFLISLILDITVPGRVMERGVYVWSGKRAARSNSSVVADYEVPLGIGKLFRFLPCVGL